jgi:hypothetical protein
VPVAHGRDRQARLPHSHVDLIAFKSGQHVAAKLLFDPAELNETNAMLVFDPAGFTELNPS